MHFPLGFHTQQGTDHTHQRRNSGTGSDQKQSVVFFQVKLELALRLFYADHIARFNRIVEIIADQSLSLSLDGDLYVVPDQTGGRYRIATMVL